MDERERERGREREEERENMRFEQQRAYCEVEGRADDASILNQLRNGLADRINGDCKADASRGTRLGEYGCVDPYHTPLNQKAWILSA